MSDDQGAFPAGNGLGGNSTCGAKWDGVNHSSALRELAAKAATSEAETLRSAADRIDTLLAENDRLMLQLNCIAERLGEILYGTVWGFDKQISSLKSAR